MPPFGKREGQHVVDDPDLPLDPHNVPLAIYVIEREAEHLALPQP
ncbi:hypothetical protein [Amycolatopsis sp. GM8]|nr:hypothetical protein [Amycolatopsis sp. GM8]